MPVNYVQLQLNMTADFSFYFHPLQNLRHLQCMRATYIVTASTLGAVVRLAILCSTPPREHLDYLIAIISLYPTTYSEASLMPSPCADLTSIKSAQGLGMRPF